MKRLFRGGIVSAWLILLLGAGPDQGPTVVVTQPDESKFPEITVYFEVRKPDHSFILDATAKEFRVTEDDRDRPIVRFEAPESTEIRPTTVVLVLDHSGSMRQDDRIGGLKRAVGTFLEGLPAGSRVAVIAFSSEVELICPFTSDAGRVREAVESLEADGSTRYFDAVAAALELLGSETGRRAVLAMTDGQDTDSQAANLKSVVVAARNLGLPVHTLGFGQPREVATRALEVLATETRGQHYMARDAAQLRSIYEEIARRLGSTYSLVYQTDRKIPDGTLRPIRIYYEKSRQVAETAVFIRGMVVPGAGWSRLFVGLLAGLVMLAFLPGWIRAKSRPAL
jgi:VWFA-related protein